MSQTPTEPRPPGRSGEQAAGRRAGRERRDSALQDDVQEREPERCGPVTIARHRKDDGRALILYARVEAATAGARRERT